MVRWFTRKFRRGEATETSDIDVVVILDELLLVASPDEQDIVNTFLESKSGGAIDFIRMSENLIAWSKNILMKNVKQT